MEYSSLIHPLQGADPQGNRIHMMREDLLPFSMGGNKVRIADEFFRDMRAKGCDTMVAYGNVRSNLCRIIANRCHMERIPCYIICSHGAGEDDHAQTSNSAMMELLGARLVPCENTRVAEAVRNLLEKLRADGRSPYYIYGNELGTGNEGTPALAYARAYHQITEYAAAGGFSFDYIFHASGTGATQAGLTCGHILAGDRTKVCGILISSRTLQRAYDLLLEGMTGAMQRLDCPWQDSFEKEIHLITDYTAGGYGLFHEEILSCARRMFGREGIPLDPVYTGKAYWGMEEYLKKHSVSGADILFVHTGGTPLFYDHLPYLTKKKDVSC